MQHAARGAAQVGATGAAQVGAAGAQQLGAAEQHLLHLLLQHFSLWHLDLQQLDLWQQLDLLQQLEAGAQQAAGAGAAQLAITGAAQVGAGAQQLGAGAQQLDLLQQPPHLCRWKAMASDALTQQNSTAAAVIVIHFIMGISWNGVLNFED